ncbi:single-stranded DNA-binding protein [Lactobacillus sp. S2-2]|uniref:single-stranded DNA-binding protein n=1 Tax=Lactobacillus sp. S2-2 TaxID=2692917 RepID=UPI001F02BDAA|nr:single-stranded DNA-binding protein [Lactobacillus sp. S2-2]MCF6515514.1 single-stranded DNA-binding protein [Lactobacillus sp. S2-2]
MINTVVVTGRLVENVDLRYSQSGAAVGNLRLAVNRRFTNQDGNREADFVNCVIWRKAAENLNQFTNKGSLIGVEGRLQTRNYDNKQGQKVYVTEVVIENFTLLESRNNNENNQANNNNHTSNSFGKSNDQVDIQDDDLPF